MTKVALDIESVLRKLPTDGATAVLAGIEADSAVLKAVRAAWLPRQHGNFDQAVKAVSAVLDGHVWHWPWFEYCLKMFSGHKVWPDNILGWDSFEPIKPEPKPKTPADSISWLSLKEARAILKVEGVKPVSTKRADTYNALYRQVPFEKWREIAMSNWKSDANSEPDLKGQAYAKIRLLTGMLSSADFMVHRAAQIGESARHEWPRPWRVGINLADKAARLMHQNQSPLMPLPGLPPFYPGDGSSLIVDLGLRHR